MHRIGGRLGTGGFGCRGVDVGIPPFGNLVSKLAALIM